MAQHSRKGADLQAITANRLSDGAVVYLTASGGWAERFADAEILQGADAAEARLTVALQSVEDRIVVEPYLFEVARSDDGAATPVSVRERVRMLGPTVRRDLGKQAENKEIANVSL